MGDVIKGICNTCGGCGFVPSTTEFGIGTTPCVSCKGTGYSRWDDFENLSPTCKVASCINSTEYLALTDAAKDGVKIVLSCGFVDMREGQWARTTLLAIFGSSPITKAAIEAL